MTLSSWRNLFHDMIYQDRLCNQECGEIFLLSENQGNGTVQTLIERKRELILRDYKINTITRSESRRKYVLSDCSNMAKTSKTDHVIIMAGSNDVNPITAALHFLKKFSAFEVNIFNNLFFNEFKLNKQLSYLSETIKAVYLLKHTLYN